MYFFKRTCLVFCASGHQFVHGAGSKYSWKLHPSWCVHLLHQWWSHVHTLAPCLMHREVPFGSSDESPPAYSHPSKCAWWCCPLESKVRAVVLSETQFPWTGIQKCWKWHHPCSRNFLDEIVKTFCCFLSLVAPRWWRQLHGVVPLKTIDFRYSIWQSGGIWQGLSSGAFTLLCHVLLTCLKVCSSSFLLVVVLPRGLALRSSASISCCHRDSLTRGRLALEQEAVRVLFCFSSIGSARDGMGSLISSVCTVLDRFFSGCLGVFKMYYDMLSWEWPLPLLIAIRRTFSFIVSLCRFFRDPFIHCVPKWSVDLSLWSFLPMSCWVSMVWARPS